MNEVIGFIYGGCCGRRIREIVNSAELGGRGRVFPELARLPHFGK